MCFEFSFNVTDRLPTTYDRGKKIYFAFDVTSLSCILVNENTIICRKYTSNIYRKEYMNKLLGTFLRRHFILQLIITSVKNWTTAIYQIEFDIFRFIW